MTVPSQLASAPDRRHLAEATGPDDELRRLAGDRPPRVGPEECRNFRGVVLPIAVERDHGLGAALQRGGESGPQGRTLALVRGLPQDRRARPLREVGGRIAGPVVDHEDRQVARGALDHAQ